jgi:hypothetical protein
VRSRPQHEDAAEEAAASLCPVWARVAKSATSYFAISADKQWWCRLKKSIVQGGLNNRSGDFRYGPVVQLENAVAEFLDQVFRVRSKHKYLGRRYKTFHSRLGLFLKVFVHCSTSDML